MFFTPYKRIINGDTFPTVNASNKNILIRHIKPVIFLLKIWIFYFILIHTTTNPEAITKLLSPF